MAAVLRSWSSALPGEVIAQAATHVSVTRPATLTSGGPAQLDLRVLAAGVYAARLEAGGRVRATTRLVVLP
jgi:hypothetical protein